MRYHYYTADVFTDQPFGGNQLAVSPDARARGLSAQQMQCIAAEFNYSKSTFVFPPDHPRHTRRVRIFTLSAAKLPDHGATAPVAEIIFTVLAGSDRDADRLDDYQCLFRSHPWLAGAFTAMLLSLAGIPLTAGFVGKFYLVAAGVGVAMWLLVIILVLTALTLMLVWLGVYPASLIAMIQQVATRLV
jgi:Phenazine biosynthesis-like protein/Proton-conducting membrane transporter